MANATILHSRGAMILLVGVSNKDQFSRVGGFLDWLALHPEQDWRKPDLGAYRDWLMSGKRRTRDRHSHRFAPAPALSAASAAAHLGSMRGRYKALLDSGDMSLGLILV